MDLYARSTFSDPDLLHSATSHACDERAGTAALLADIGEIDARRLFLPAGYHSLAAYCRDALKLSDDAASRRIHAARAARKFPAIFAMCADGRLSLTAINLLAPHLTDANADEWLVAAAGHSKGAIDELIRARKPVTESIGWIQPLQRPAPARAEATGASATIPLTTAGRVSSEPVPPAPQPAPARVRPIACERFAVQGTLGRQGADALRFAQATTGHDLSSVLEAALVLYEAHLRKRKCGATQRPQARPRATKSIRHIPARVRRAVWKRDRGQCAFTSSDGHRCGSRDRLQYDHVVPIARGGESTVDNVRLLCAAHNFHEAERILGAAFMADRRAPWARLVRVPRAIDRGPARRSG